jgi:hypothetical protein
MNNLRRIITALACAVLVVGAAATPASAHDVDFVFPQPNGWRISINCPHPYLKTGFGRLSLCTTGTPGVVENRDVGLYSPDTNEFSVTLANVPFGITDGTLERNVLATDGIRGTFRGGPTVATPFGNVKYGIQYIVYLLQPIGRTGNYNLLSNRFYPDSGWFHAEHDL